MKLGITFPAEWNEIEEKMDLVWDEFFERDAEMKDEKDFQSFEKLPKSEGTGRRIPGSRSSRNK